MAEQTKENTPKALQEKRNVSLLLRVISIVPIIAMLAFFLVTKVVNPRFASPVSDEAEDSYKEESQKKTCIYELGTALVNPSGKGNRRIMKVGVSLEVTSKSLMEDISKSEARLRHQLIMALSSRDVDSVCSLEGKTALQAELKDIFTSELGLEPGELCQVYFTEFIVQ